MDLKTYLERSRLVFVVVGVGLQIVHVNVRQPTDQQFQLLLIENGN